MTKNKSTGMELQKILAKDGIIVSARTDLRLRNQLGWTSKGTNYCQMIRDTDKEKPLAWAREYKDLNFEDVVYTAENTVQIETHRRMCCYKKGQKPRYKSKPDHSVKVWAGISHCGRTNLCIFEENHPSYANR